MIERHEKLVSSVKVVLTISIYVLGFLIGGASMVAMFIFAVKGALSKCG